MLVGRSQKARFRDIILPVYTKKFGDAPMSCMKSVADSMGSITMTGHELKAEVLSRFEREKSA